MKKILRYSLLFLIGMVQYGYGLEINDANSDLAALKKFKAEVTKKIKEVQDLEADATKSLKTNTLPLALPPLKTNKDALTSTVKTIPLGTLQTGNRSWNNYPVFWSPEDGFYQVKGGGTKNLCDLQDQVQRATALKTVRETFETYIDPIDTAIQGIEDEKKEEATNRHANRNAFRQAAGNFADMFGKIGQEGAKANMEGKQFGKNLQKGIREFFKPANIKSLGKIAVGAGTALIVAKKTADLGFGLLDEYIKKPDLIDETSLPENLLEYLLGKEKKESRLEDFMAPDEVKGRLVDLVQQTQNAKTTGQTFKNILCYGPPGTGKTMFSKIIASESGLDFAMFSGANFKKFGKIEQAVTELEKIIKWARKCKNGLLIFVDEAEMLFASRDTPDATPESIALTLKFLAMVDKPSDSDLMWVFASNHRGAIDSAIESRISESFEFQLPTKETAVAMFLQYLNKFDIFIDDALRREIYTITHLFEDLSGRDIEETAKDVSRQVFTNDKQLTFALIKQTIEYKRLKNATSKKEREKFQMARFGRKISQ